MLIKSVRLCNFRNAALAQAEFPLSAWIYGANAQGKTNLLESCALMWALRSFRTSKMANLVKSGESCAQVLANISHEVLGECEVLIEISKSARRVFVNGAEQKKLGEFIGKFPAIAVCSDDIKLVRGAPMERRRFADMLISSISMDYFEALRRYHASLVQRNALLKLENPDEASLDAFESQMAESAVAINKMREKYFETIGKIATQKYGILSGGAEKSAIRLKPDAAAETAQEYAELLKSLRAKDIVLGSTSAGPHKDDFLIFVSGKNVREFASEGQQRSVALSLKLAQFEMVKGFGGVLPVLLCDDILGELDASRKAAFWSCIEPGAQVIATSTNPAPQSPARAGWRVIEAKNGQYFVR
ncbi:MAG: DNA replication/repair protein RecF [Opitutales bacterium]|nr:DNA replication/repair protein RecF [Opitutales bacterium]